MSTFPSSNYFNRLNQMLLGYDRSIPFLLVDLDLLDENMAMLQQSISKDRHFRLVVKSLPSSGMIDYIRERSGCTKLMVFHQPFLSELAIASGSEVDILLGKPMPIKTAAYFYKSIARQTLRFDPSQQLQWLVDTKERLLEYLQLSKSINQKIRINLEIDVGLHRGGFSSLLELQAALELIQENKTHLVFSGLMGYDPHVAKIPSIIKSRKKALNDANEFYNSCKELIQSQFPGLWSEQLTFNGAGSPTIELHESSHSPLNDISAGSCLVKPTTFDLNTLADYQPAAFIATPVLKKMKGTTIPALERFSGLMQLINPNYRQSYFIYGGYWKADYCYPKGVKANRLYGASTNQSMINAPKGTKLEVDDFVFLRPQQSEYVFLHFGKILAFRNFEVVDEWEVLGGY